MAQRKAIPKKIRFEVFKRDKFTCQYCGRSAPDVLLQIDHIKPVSKGGDNDIMNLVTSCRDCNLGKGARELSDDSVIKKQQAQIKELAERKEQLEMMLEWRNKMLNLKDDEIEKVKEYFSNKTDGMFQLTDSSNVKIRKILREFSILEILDAMDIAFEQYYDGSKESLEVVLKNISGICNNKKRGQSSQSYWFNYLKKVCAQKYGYIGRDKADRLKVICFKCLKTEKDFEVAKTLLFENRNLYWYIENLEQEFL